MKANKGGKSSKKTFDTDPNLLRALQQFEAAGKKVVVNESKAKYSAMLLELVKPYHEPLPDIDDLEDLLELGVIAWNMANMKILVPGAYKTMLQETKKDLKNDKLSVQLLEKMVADKESKFAEYDMFIHEFDINQIAEDDFYVTVVARPFESFLGDGLFDEEEEFDAAQPGYINRNAFIVKPQQPFINWLKKQDTDPSFTLNFTGHTIYLTGERANEKETKKWLKENFDTLFKKELEAWYSDEKLWPFNRTYKMFQQWFTVEYHSRVYDLKDFPVDKDIL